ncbi:putative Retrovirus-related Pol polyprotein from transposon TNT 1-94 [Cocos nucifera]|nr:putative Retrovirus-related Pol polyprotein from transposon TNT 1-94 [Cocos nucifera]
MDEVTVAILHNEIFRRKNPASSSDDNSSALAVSKGMGGKRWSDRESRGGRSRSKTRDPSKIRCYKCDELEHRVKDCP